MLSSHLDDIDALNVLCSASEFDQLKVRPDELEELDKLKKTATVEIKGPVEDTAGKVNALLQGYISQSRLNSFTLQSDTNYVAQNAGRISRALFEICLKRGWSTIAAHYLSLSKCIERRIRTDQSIFRQFIFDEVPSEVLKRLEQHKCDIQQLRDMTPPEIGQLIHNMKYGGRILNLAKKFPLLTINARAQPITRGILKLHINIQADFEWVDRYHGNGEPFWIWVEDGINEYIYHSEHVLIMRKQRTEPKTIEFIIPIREPLPSQYYIMAVSDRYRVFFFLKKKKE